MRGGGGLHPSHAAVAAAKRRLLAAQIHDEQSPLFQPNRRRPLSGGFAFGFANERQPDTGTGLREHEIAALDVGDVLHEDGRVRRRIALRTFKRSSTEPATQEVFIPDSLFYKLGKLVSWKRGQGESLAADAPLFVSRRGRRISTRTLRYLFAVWQRRHRFKRLPPSPRPPRRRPSTPRRASARSPGGRTSSATTSSARWIASSRR